MMLLGINHVAIHVSNLQKSIDFYREVLLLPMIGRPDMGFDGAWLGMGEQEIHLIAGLTGNINSQSRGNHFAFETASINAAQQHFQMVNVEFRAPKQRPDGAWQIFLQDPDGYFIEIYQRFKQNN